MTKTLKYSAILLLGALLFSCTLQKRHFRPGYYLAWKNEVTSKSGRDGSQARTQNNELKELPLLAKIVDSQSDPMLTVSAAKQANPALAKQGRILPSGNCDTLILRKGGEISAKVIEITPTEIKYKKCDFQDGPLFVIAKNDVAFIRYSNGLTEAFKVENNISNRTIEQRLDEMQVKRDAESSLLYGLLGLPAMLLGGVGLISLWYAVRTGNRALKMMRSDARLRALYRPKAMAGYIIGMTVFAIAIAIFLLAALFTWGTGFVSVFCLIIGGALALALYLAH